MGKKKKKVADFQYGWPELMGLILRGDDIGRRKLKVVRYWAFRFLSEIEWKAALGENVDGAQERYDRIVKANKAAPKGLKKYIENLPGFGGWEAFGTTWDLRGHNPFICVYRLMSLWTEWDHIMDRVAVPLDASPAEIRARVKALEQEYVEGRYDSTH